MPVVEVTLPQLTDPRCSQQAGLMEGNSSPPKGSQALSGRPILDFHPSQASSSTREVASLQPDSPSALMPYELQLYLQNELGKAMAAVKVGALVAAPDGACPRATEQRLKLCSGLHGTAG